MTVKLQGTGFTPRLAYPEVEGASHWQLSLVSFTEAIITLTNPKPLVVIKLRDTVTQGADRAVIQRPPTPQEEAKQEEN